MQNESDLLEILRHKKRKLAQAAQENNFTYTIVLSGTGRYIAYVHKRACAICGFKSRKVKKKANLCLSCLIASF